MGRAKSRRRERPVGSPIRENAPIPVIIPSRLSPVRGYCPLVARLLRRKRSLAGTIVSALTTASVAFSSACFRQSYSFSLSLLSLMNDGVRTFAARASFVGSHQQQGVGLRRTCFGDDVSRFHFPRQESYTSSSILQNYYSNLIFSFFINGIY